MGYEPCRKCGESRRTEDYGGAWGFHTPPHAACGDPGYFEYEDGRVEDQEPTGLGDTPGEVTP
jgi:hypothetical protein